MFVFSAVHHSLELFLRNWLLYKLCNYRCVSQEHTVRSQRVQCLHLEIFLRSPNMNLYSKLEAEDSFGGVQKLSFRSAPKKKTIEQYGRNFYETRQYVVVTSDHDNSSSKKDFVTRIRPSTDRTTLVAKPVAGGRPHGRSLTDGFQQVPLSSRFVSPNP